MFFFYDESKRAVLKECVHDTMCEAIQWLMEYCNGTTITYAMEKRLCKEEKKMEISAVPSDNYISVNMW